MRLPSLYAATNEGSAAVAETLEKCTCGVLSDSRVDKLDIYEGEWRRTRGGAEGGVGTEIRSKRQKRGGGGGGGPPNRYSSHGGTQQASWRATTTSSRVNHQSTYSSIPEDRLVEPVAPTSKKLIVYEWDPTYLLAQGSTTYEVVSCYSWPPPPPPLANSTCCPSLCSNTPGSGTHSLLLQQESS